jgi:hypothetical protein
MPDDSRKFANDWQCGAGTVCTTLSTVPDTGLRLAQCLLPKDSEAMFSGHPCLTGTIETNVGQPYNDRQTKTGQFAAFAKKISRDKYTCRPAAHRRAGRHRLPQLQSDRSQLRQLQARRVDAQRDLRAGGRQEVRPVRGDRRFFPTASAAR